MSDPSRLAEALHGVVTRRAFIEKSVRWGLVVGGSTAAWIGAMTGEAKAANCSYYGHVSTWGTDCASTARCGPQHCQPDGGCGVGTGTRKRCNYWTVPSGDDNNYCWCSQKSCRGGEHGWFLCCDCWQGPGGGACQNQNGDAPCICRKWRTDGPC